MIEVCLQDTEKVITQEEEMATIMVGQADLGDLGDLVDPMDLVGLVGLEGLVDHPVSLATEEPCQMLTIMMVKDG